MRRRPWIVGGSKPKWEHDFTLTEEEFKEHGFELSGRKKKGSFAAVYIGPYLKDRADEWTDWDIQYTGPDPGTRYYTVLRLENGDYALMNGRKGGYGPHREICKYNKLVVESLKPEGELIREIDGIEYRRGDLISYEPTTGWGGVIFRIVGGGKKCATVRPIFQLCRTFKGDIDDACSQPIQVSWRQVVRVDLQLLMEEAVRLRALIGQETKRQARVMEKIAKENDGSG